MYNRLIIAIILFTLCIGFAGGSYICLKKMTDDVEKVLSSFSESIKDGNIYISEKAINNATEKWTKYKKYFSVILDHSIFEELNIDIPTTKKLFLSGNIEDSLEKCFECIDALESIMEEQRINIGNVF